MTRPVKRWHLSFGIYCDRYLIADYANTESNALGKGPIPTSMHIGYGHFSPGLARRSGYSKISVPFFLSLAARFKVWTDLSVKLPQKFTTLVSTSDFTNAGLLRQMPQTIFPCDH